MIENVELLVVTLHGGEGVFHLGEGIEHGGLVGDEGLPLLGGEDADVLVEATGINDGCGESGDDAGEHGLG